jgi:hypothetical protein
MLNLYAYATLLDALREFLAALFFKFQALWLGIPICILQLNVFVQFAAMIINHVYRLDHGGKVCSGDYVGKEELLLDENKTLYLERRGFLLWVLLVIYWVIFAVAGLGIAIAITALARSRK